MTLQEILNYLNGACSNNGNVSIEKFEEIIIELASIVKKQNDILLDIKNSNIRLENKIKYIENELERSKVYREVVDSMMARVKRNPLVALIYLYKVKANIDRITKN